MKRPITRATAEVGIVPIYCSDLTAPIVVGLEPHQFRALVADLKIPHVRRGHRLLVEMGKLRAALDRVETSTGAPDAEPTAGEILASLGRRAS